MQRKIQLLQNLLFTKGQTDLLRAQQILTGGRRRLKAKIQLGRRLVHRHQLLLQLGQRFFLAVRHNQRSFPIPLLLLLNNPFHTLNFPLQIGVMAQGRFIIGLTLPLKSRKVAFIKLQMMIKQVHCLLSGSVQKIAVM